MGQIATVKRLLYEASITTYNTTVIILTVFTLFTILTILMLLTITITYNSNKTHITFLFCYFLFI